MYLHCIRLSQALEISDCDTAHITENNFNSETYESFLIESHASNDILQAAHLKT